MSTNGFKNTTYPSPTLFDGLQNASKEELSYLIALLRCKCQYKNVQF